MLARLVTFWAAGGLLEERRARLEVVDEVDNLLPRLGVRERRHADVVLARGKSRDDRRDVALTTLTFNPSSGKIAFARSASMPTTVWPSEPMNSFGA